MEENGLLVGCVGLRVMDTSRASLPPLLGDSDAAMADTSEDASGSEDSKSVMRPRLEWRAFPAGQSPPDNAGGSKPLPFSRFTW